MHRPHVVTGETPVAFGIRVAELQRIPQAELDCGRVVRDLARDELQSPSRRLMVEENPADREESIRLAIVDRRVMRKDLGRAVRAARMEGRSLVLGRLDYLAEHLAGRRLIEARPRRAASADSVKRAERAEAGYL